ncbi:MAG: SCO family protein [Singulisphaera sp.]
MGDGRWSRFSRSTATYELPDVSLVEMTGEAVSLASALDHGGQSCSTRLHHLPDDLPRPVGHASAAQGKLGQDLERTRMVTISIDPEHDTPARLRAYARSLRAGPQWRFFTGRAEAVEAVLKAFDAYRGNKMRHEPLTFLRPSRDADWIRLAGLMGAEDLVSEYRRSVKK